MMLPRIKNNLNEFLHQYNLEINSRIFENSIPVLAELEMSEIKKKGFYFIGTPNNTGCIFVAPKLDEENKYKLLNFCGLAKPIASANEVGNQKSSLVNNLNNNPSDSDSENEEESEENDSMTIYSFEEKFEISEYHLEATVVPIFKQFITTLNASNPDFLKLYQIKSRSIFEANALKATQEHAFLLLDAMNTHKELTKEKLLLKTKLTDLITAIKTLKRYDEYDYQALDEKLNEFNKIFNELEKCEMRKNILYGEKIEKILDNFKKYMIFNPMKEYLKWKSIISDLNAFLFDLKISIHECNIFENILLELAGISKYVTQCKFEMDREDPSCMSILISNLSLEDAGIFLKFFHENGAASAKITSSFYEKCEDQMRSDDSRELRIYRPFPSVEYQIDFIEMKNFIIPLFCAKINELKSCDPLSFKSYQIASKMRFHEKNAIEKVITESNESEIKPNPGKPAMQKPLEQHAHDGVFSLFYHENKIQEGSEKVNTKQSISKKHNDIGFNN